MNGKFKKTKVVVVTVIFLLFFVLESNGQFSYMVGSDPVVIGWEDDSHFLIDVIGPDGKDIIESVNVKSGKAVDSRLPESPYNELRESLSSFETITSRDVFSEDYQAVIKIKDNDLFYFKIGDSQFRQLTNDPQLEVNSRFSPDDGKVAYTKMKDLYVYDIINNREIRLTTDASDKIYNGYASWVYMEEILGRASNYAAFWWSPDGSKLAFLRTDETEIPFFTLNRLDQPDGLHGTLEVSSYPKAGEPTPKIKMGIADVESGQVTWVKTDYSVDQYIAWPFWTPDSKELAIQVVNRDQNELKIILADVFTGEVSEIYSERNSTWVEFREDIYVINDGSGFILRSYKSGWENLYYYDWKGVLISQLTDFDFRVTSISGVDEEKRLVYFTATGEEPTNDHFYRVGLNGKNLIKITQGGGTHDVQVSPKGNYFVDTWSSVAKKGAIDVYDKNGKMIFEFHKFESPESAPICQMVTIPTADALFEMPAIITYPVGFDSTKKYPVLFKIYGGPDSKNVYNRWQGDYPSWYSENGIIVFTVDHRGSGQFGRRGLDYLYRNLGEWEVLDYIDAVKWLTTLTYVDNKRIGITGSSYGGYMTCLALTKGAGYWTHGFAGSPVTDWRLYDNIYTERFMDTPRDKSDGYVNGSVLTYANQLEGELYINHGDVDDNVHMQNSLWLISKLQDEGKSFRFMIYPDQRHGFGAEKRVHSSNEERTFWLENFFGE